VLRYKNNSYEEEMTLKIQTDGIIAEVSFSPIDIALTIFVSFLIVFFGVLGAVIVSRGIV